MMFMNVLSVSGRSELFSTVTVFPPNSLSHSLALFFFCDLFFLSQKFPKIPALRKRLCLIPHETSGPETLRTHGSDLPQTIYVSECLCLYLSV